MSEIGATFPKAATMFSLSEVLKSLNVKDYANYQLTSILQSLAKHAQAPNYKHLMLEIRLLTGIICLTIMLRNSGYTTQTTAYYVSTSADVGYFRYEHISIVHAFKAIAFNCLMQYKITKYER